MKLSSSLALSFMAGTALGAAIAPRDDNPVPPGYCCFHLQDNSSGKLAQQDADIHELFINDANAPWGWYCINQNAGSQVLYDRDFNACILTSPGNEFQCFDGTPGGDTWKIATSGSGTVVLEDYGNTKFKVCNVNGRQQIFGVNPPSGLSCQETQLNIVDRTGQCKW